MNEKLLERFKNREIVIFLDDKQTQSERLQQVGYLKRIMKELGYSNPNGDSTYYVSNGVNWAAYGNHYLAALRPSYEIVTPEDFFTETPKSSEVSNYSVF